MGIIEKAGASPMNINSLYFKLLYQINRNDYSLSTTFNVPPCIKSE